MKKMIIFGCSPYSKLLRYTMEKEVGIGTWAYCLSQDYLTDDNREFDGRPVLPFEQLDQLLGKGAFQVLITVGYRGMNQGREKIFSQCDELSYEIASFIHPDVKNDAEAMGRGNIIMEGSRIYPFCQIGDGNILNGAVIGHESVVGNFNFMARCTTGGLAEIGNNCFIGIGACINDNVKIGNYSLIGAGATVAKRVRDNTIVIPAKNHTMRSNPDDLGGLL